MDLKVVVKEIKGNCPVYERGDSFILKDGYRLVAEKPLCMHALSSLMPHYNAFRFADPGRWGAAGKEDSSKIYFQCLDPVDYTGGGTAIFELSRVPGSGNAAEKAVNK